MAEEQQLSTTVRTSLRKTIEASSSNEASNTNTLFLSSVESYYLFEHLRGWPYDIYLEFDDKQNKLKQVHTTGKRTEERAKQLGLSYEHMYKLDAKKGSELYSAISSNRANSSGTEVTMEVKGQEIVDVVVHSVRGFDF